MLGGPCSECCGCNLSAAHKTWLELQERNYTVTIGGTLPRRDAATISQGFSSDAAPNASVSQPSTWQWQYVKQTADIRGTHDLALQFQGGSYGPGNLLSDPGTIWFDAGVGYVSLVAQGDDYEARLLLRVATGEGSISQYEWPSSKCGVIASLWFAFNLPTAYAQGAPGSAISSNTLTKNATVPWNGSTVTKSILTTSPPYSIASGSAVVNAFRDASRGPYPYSFNGVWDFSAKPDSLAWDQNQFWGGAYQTSREASDGSVSITFSEIIRDNVSSSVWVDGPAEGWVKNLSPGNLEYWPDPSLAGWYQGPAFVAEYESADKHYATSTIRAAVTISVDSTLPPP